MDFKCTFTGVDADTDCNRIEQLVKAYPYVEFGILFSYSRQGQGRYPTIEGITQFVDWFNKMRWETGNNGLISLHVCGKAVKDLLGLEPRHDTALIDLKQLIAKVNRVQLNINLGEQTGEWVKASIGRAIEDLGKEYRKPFILQYNANNAVTIDFITGYYLPQYIHILKDASGGNGVYTDDYSIPTCCSKNAIGFAGGLSVDNVEQSLKKAHESVMSHNVEGSNDNKLFWIDMESSVRTDDKFDLDKVESVLKIVDEQYRGWL